MLPSRRLAWFYVLLLLLGVGQWAHAEADPAEDLSAFGPRLTEVAEQCRAATVGIVIPGGSMGSGVLVSEDGLIMTAAHVLPDDLSDVVIVLSDGRQVTGKCLGVNRKVDSGMARIVEPGPYPFAPMAEPGTVWEGDWVIAFGHGGGVQTDRPAPMRLGRALHISSSSSDTRWITTDCTVISGDSGGPLFDLKGDVIGIHSNIGMSVLVNRHVPMSAYVAQWDELLKKGEIDELPTPAEPLMPGLETLPDGIEREIARRFNSGDEELRKKLEASKNEAGRVELTPEEAAELLGRDDLLEEIRAYRDRLRERERRTNQIENAGSDPDAEEDESDVSRQSRATRALILQKKRERLLEDIAEDLRRTHGKIAKHVLSRFEPAVSAAGPGTVEVLSQGQVVALGTIVREDGYIVTKASELAGPARVRINGEEYFAMVVNGNGPNDLALLKIKASKLTPVRWADQSPTIGTLLVVPDASGKPLAMGIASVDARPIPKGINNLRVAPPGKPFLGVDDLTRDKDADGLTVGEVVEDSPAAKAGLKVGDVITAVNGEAVTSIVTIVRAIKKADIGGKLKLTVTRGAQTLELEATIDKTPPPKAEDNDDRNSAAQVYSARGGKLSERRTDFPMAMQHDAIIWANDIGGPVLNLDGEAVGLNIARYGRTATYALPAEQARQAIDAMMQGGDRVRFRDEHHGFDPIYRELCESAASAKKTDEVHRGGYDWQRRPDGFPEAERIWKRQKTVP